MIKTVFNTIATAGVALSCVLSADAGERFVINGFVPGVADSVRIQLRDIEREEPRIISEVYTTDGHFTFSDTIGMPTLCDIALTTRAKDGQFYRPKVMPRIMVEAGEIGVEFSCPTDSLFSVYIQEPFVKVKGSETNSQLMEYVKECGAAEENWKRARSLYADKWFETHNNPDSMPRYEAMKKAATDAYMEANRNYIKTHPDQHISSVLTMKEMLNIYTYTEPQLKEMYETVSECPDRARLNLNKRAYEWGKKYALMMRYPDFEVNDTAGVTNKMSDYITDGKYTFLDFWASWCGPCRASIPHVKEIKQQLGDNIDFFSISIDKDKDAWRKAMEKEQMDWTQLHLEGQQFKDVVNLYCLNSIPRMMLLDPEGRIVCSTYLPEVMDECIEKHFDNGFAINGIIPDLKEGTKIELVNKDIRNDGSWLVVDTVSTAGGFRLEGHVDMPTYCELRIYLDEENYKTNVAYLMVENMPITVSAASVDSIPPIFSLGPRELYRAKNVKIDGGEAQREFMEFREYLLPYEAKMKQDHYNLYGDQSLKPTAEEKVALSKKYEESQNEYKNAIERFVEAHPDYHISAMYWVKNLSRPFVYSTWELDSIWKQVNKNTSPARVAMLKSTIDKTRDYVRDTKYSDFEGMDPEGVNHKLSEFIHNAGYTLVDFWASWCGPCRASIPKVRELYNEFGNGLNVISVSVDKKEDDWRKAMDKEKMEWTQLKVTPENGSVLGDVYNFSTIPFMLLIDHSGNIVFAGHDLEKISEILKH